MLRGWRPFGCFTTWHCLCVRLLFSCARRRRQGKEGKREREIDKKCLLLTVTVAYIWNTPCDRFMKLCKCCSVLPSIPPSPPPPPPVAKYNSLCSVRRIDGRPSFRPNNTLTVPMKMIIIWWHVLSQPAIRCWSISALLSRSLIEGGCGRLFGGRESTKIKGHQWLSVTLKIGQWRSVH